MEHQHRDPHVVKVVLPSGRTIEVLYVEDVAAPPPEERQATDRPVEDMHICLNCDSPLVSPVEWHEAGPEHWSVLLHCPNCDLYREGIFTQETVERFDEELDRGADQVARDYHRLMRANLAEEVDRFAAALSADAVLPEDF